MELHSKSSVRDRWGPCRLRKYSSTLETLQIDTQHDTDHAEGYTRYRVRVCSTFFFRIKRRSVPLLPDGRPPLR